MYCEIQKDNKFELKIENIPTTILYFYIKGEKENL